MKRLLLIVVLAATVTGCGSGAETPEAKVDAAIASLGADRATMAQQRVIDGNYGPQGGAVNRTIYLVPKEGGVWIIDEQGEIHDGYYAFLRDNSLR